MTKDRQEMKKATISYLKSSYNFQDRGVWIRVGSLKNRLEKSRQPIFGGNFNPRLILKNVYPRVLFQFVCAVILLSRLMLIYADSLPDPDAQPDPEALPGPEVINWHSIYTRAVKIC